jgi:hypothetical protein
MPSDWTAADSRKVACPGQRPHTRAQTSLTSEGSLVRTQLRTRPDGAGVQARDPPCGNQGCHSHGQDLREGAGATCEIVRDRAPHAEKGPSITPERTTLICGNWSGRPDLNRRPLDPPARIRCLGRSDVVGRGEAPFADSSREVVVSPGESEDIGSHNWLPGFQWPHSARSAVTDRVIRGHRVRRADGRGVFS